MFSSRKQPYIDQRVLFGDPAIPHIQKPGNLAKNSCFHVGDVAQNLASIADIEINWFYTPITQFDHTTNQSFKMVFDVIMGLGISLPVAAATGVGVVTGVAQGVSHQQKENEKAANANPESRTTKFYIDVVIEDEGSRSRGRGEILHDSIVVVRDNKLWIEAKNRATGLPRREDSHPFTGFYLMYPDEDRSPAERGLVTTIQKDPPMLNWIYVDNETFELKYSNRSGSITQKVGPWDWTDEFIDSSITLNEWEGFLAVEEEMYRNEQGHPRWALYYDWNDDGLKGRKKGRRTMEISLKRRLVENQEKNQWGVGREGNIGVTGFKATREV
ncbi:hypothetical protein D6D23_07872 [Aureobasidium pullulans]|nr:hypothetical protein D6D23_07872 [Aureobasidium pullulans]